MTGTEAVFVKIDIILPCAKDLHFRDRKSAIHGCGMPSLRLLETLMEGLNPSTREYVTAINPLRTRNHDARWLRKRYKALRRAALRGNGEALNDLGWIFFNELCYPANQGLAETLFELATVTGSRGEAWFNLAQQALTEPVHLVDSVKKAACFYRLAEAHGMGCAGTQLGHLYLGAEGHDVDVEQARKWYLRGAESGDSEAAYHLGVLLLDPSQPVHDKGNAVYWLQSAALGDEQQAIACLRDFYESEEGTRLDPEGRLLAFWAEHAERVYGQHLDPDNELPWWPYKLIKENKNEHL